MLPDPGRWGKTRKENRNARFVRFDLCIIFVANHQLHGTEAIYTHTHTHTYKNTNTARSAGRIVVAVLGIHRVPYDPTNVT